MEGDTVRQLKLNVMSFNIRNMRAQDGENRWERRREFLFEVIRRHHPDIVGTQEAYHPQVQEMLQALPDYAAVGVGREDGKMEGEHCALFFQRDRFQVERQGTFWFSDTPDAPGSRHWTRVHARICTWVRLIAPSGQTAVVYNVHLDHESQSARRQSVHLLNAVIREQEHPDPVLVIGDFNMEEDDPAIVQMREGGARRLQDTFRRLHPEKEGIDREGVGTFHDFTGATDGEKIDFIFASPEFRVLDAQILHDNDAGRYPSDHFPITALVSLE